MEYRVKCSGFSPLFNAKISIEPEVATKAQAVAEAKTQIEKAKKQPVNPHTDDGAPWDDVRIYKGNEDLFGNLMDIQDTDFVAIIQNGNVELIDILIEELNKTILEVEAWYESPHLSPTARDALRESFSRFRVIMQNIKTLVNAIAK